MRGFDVGGKTVYELAAALIERGGLHAHGHYARDGFAASVVGALAWGARYVALSTVDALHGQRELELCEPGLSISRDHLTREAMARVHEALGLPIGAPLDASCDEIAKGEGGLDRILNALGWAHSNHGDAPRSPRTERA